MTYFASISLSDDFFMKTVVSLLAAIGNARDI
jgi:hypothetical protein